VLEYLQRLNIVPGTRHKSRKPLVHPEHGFTVIYELLLEGGYQVIVPELPGIVTYGPTIVEAREVAEDAIRCHLRALLKDGEEISKDPFSPQPPITKKLRVSI